MNHILKLLHDVANDLLFQLEILAHWGLHLLLEILRFQKENPCRRKGELVAGEVTPALHLGGNILRLLSQADPLSSALGFQRIV